MTVEEQQQAQRDLDVAKHTVLVTLDVNLCQEAQEAADEVLRELGVRDRCYPKWMDTGKLSKTEAKDRMNRMSTALYICNALITALENQPGGLVARTGDKTEEAPF